MENTMNEQAAAARAAQDKQATQDGTNCHTDGTPYTDLERVSESQYKALLHKREGVPVQQDGTPYEYQDAGPEALSNCNRQLSTCSVWTAVWAGKTKHNGNVMYRIEHLGERYYYYRDLVKALGAPVQRAEKSEVSKARKAAAAAQAAALAEAQEQAAAALAQLSAYTDALTAAAKDGLRAADVVRTLERQEQERAHAAEVQAYKDSLPQGLTDKQIKLLADAQFPAAADVEEVNSECTYDDDDDDEKPSETALLEQKAAAMDTSASQPAKAAKKAVKTAKQGTR